MTHTHKIMFYRKRSALTQGELAGLLATSQSEISRMEKTGKANTASLETVLGLEVIFGPAPRALFPELYAEVEEAVMTRAAELEVALRDKFDPDSVKKKEWLDAMMNRATSRINAL